MTLVSSPSATGARTAATVFRCSACLAVARKWAGRCAACGAWNALDEVAARADGGPRPGADDPIRPVLLDDAAVRTLAPRFASGLAEVDRVLGGGLVPGSLVLLGGDPGIGKSTLALTLALRCGSAARPALYAAGEESPAQIALRAGRTGCAGPEIAVVAETDLDAVVAAIESLRPPLVVVDSVQTVHAADAPGAPGSVSQVREAAFRLLRCAKATGTPILLVGHVTKDGAIAGPRTLEHMVDVVLHLEGERHGEHRLLRGVKNRFGATDDIGILVLDDEGIREAPCPGRAFVEEATLGVPGSAITILCEGSRPLAVEVQALEAESSLAMPRRTASGFDHGRLCLLLAVLEKRSSIDLSRRDVYLNAVGGVRLTEPAVDLSVVLALASTARGRPLPAGLVTLGEVGLGGEIRRVGRLERRLAEAAALGLEEAVVPASQPLGAPAGMRVWRVASVAEAVQLLA